MSASIVDKRTPKWHDQSGSLRTASTAAPDAAAAAQQLEDAHYAGRLVDAYCAGDSLVRAMLGLPTGVAS